jgi:hypothetical protein
MSKRTRTFKGPLFVVGMSRSGTSLLREVLNRNPEVGFPYHESHFIPYIIHRFRDKAFPLNQQQMKEFRNIVKESNFYGNFQAQGWLLRDSELYEMLRSGSLAETIENIIKFFIPHNIKKTDFIWGDKSPNNLLSIGLLKDFFPKAQFIHIIRDPRERVLSAHKAWGADLYIAAERWRHGIQTARQLGQQLGDDYLEVFYEKFTGAPTKEIIKLCNFLGISYDKAMIELKRPFEKHTAIDSATRRATRIISGNTEKYMNELKPKQIRRIDEIVFPIARLDYCPMNSETTHIPLKGTEKMAGHLTDSFNTIIWHFRRFGIARGLKYLRWRFKWLYIIKTRR